MESRRCAACRLVFRPRPQVPMQCYCPAAACKRERRRLWQKEKRRGDSDYRDNQARAQHAWCERNPDYWREYRIEHPQYVERNRTQQRERNARQRERRVAKMNASPPDFPVPSGIYRISKAPSIRIAKMDAWIVEITLLSIPSRNAAKCCKETTS